MAFSSVPDPWYFGMDPDPYLWLTDPEPPLVDAALLLFFYFVSDLQDANKKKIFLLINFWGHICIILLQR